MSISIQREHYLKFGYIEFENFFLDDEFKEIKNFVDQKIIDNNNKSFFLTSKTNSEIDNFFKNNFIINQKIEKVVKQFNFMKNDDYNYETYKCLRVLKNNRIKEQTRDFHFDSHQLTILIPIYIPNREGSENGHLMMSPKLRIETTSIVKNIFQKLVYQSKILSKLTKFEWFRKKINLQKIILKPKSIFIFNGFTNLHGNLEIFKEDTRATLLIHAYDLFKNSKLVNFNRNLRIFLEKRNIKKNISNV
jgi:hypothetical protein